MLTYRFRKRVFRIAPSDQLRLPAQAKFKFLLAPGQAFGVADDGGRTLVRGSPAKILFNAHSGEHTATSETPLSPLEVVIAEKWGNQPQEDPNRVVRLLGNSLTVEQEVSSLQEAEEFLAGITYILPALLNITFADPPTVTQITGEIGGVPFSWELIDWGMKFIVTSQEHQERLFATAWEQLPLVAGLENRRLAAAAHYFYIAVRLDRAAGGLGEFMAETLLNLTKTLDVLFPTSGGEGSRDAIRAGLSELGFGDEEIERDYLPAVALRNEIDVGHVSLALFTREQLATIHAYAERAEGAFRTLLTRALERAAEGSWTPKPYGDPVPSRRVLDILSRLQSADEPRPPRGSGPAS